MQGYQVMFAVQHEHALMHHAAYGAEQMSQWAMPDRSLAGHAYCFQFTIAAVLHETVDGTSLRPVLHGCEGEFAMSIVPDRPHKPPKPA